MRFEPRPHRDQLIIVQYFPQDGTFYFIQEAKQAAEKLSRSHCEERFLRRGNLVVIDFVETEITSLRSQRRQKTFSVTS
jgi:hypothetical protein